MSNYGDTVTRQLKRYGKPCTIHWPALGMGSTARAATSLSSYIRISQRSVYNAAGTSSFVTLGMLPATASALQGASITVGAKTYKVTGYVESVADGETYMQKVTLE